MTLIARLRPFRSRRHGSIAADGQARLTDQLTAELGTPASEAIERVRTPWRWNPAKHERMRPAPSS